MNTDELKDANKIAYDKPLRERLKELSDFLSTDITDVASGASEYGLKFAPDAKNVIKEMSKLDADLTVALIEVRGKGELNKEEKEDFELIKGLTESLGNLQFKINKIIKKSEHMNKLSQELVDDSLNAGLEVMNTQEQFRKVRKKINAIGILSNNPDIAFLLD